MTLLYARGRHPDGTWWARLLSGLIGLQWRSADASTAAKVTVLGAVGVVGVVTTDSPMHLEIGVRILFIDCSIKLGLWPTLP